MKKLDAYHNRFERTIRQSGFHTADEVLRWRTTWPPGAAPHSVVHYGFKVHAIEEARRRGADRVIYLDIPCHAIRSMEPIWQQVERDGHFFMVGGDLLGNYADDRCLAQFDVSRDEAMEMQLFSGTIIGLDFRQARTREFFERLRDYAVPLYFNGTHNGLGGALPRRLSEDSRCWEHRSDEPYATLLARELKMEPTWRGGYFIGDMDEHDTAILKSGYTIDPKAKIEPVLEVVAEHTVDAARIGAGGWVLDAGCRNFDFARAMAARGCKVVAMDPDPTIEPQPIEGVEFLREALDVNGGQKRFVMSEDPQARHVEPASGARSDTSPRVTVMATAIEDIMAARGIMMWDVVKLDIEGAEYGILKCWPGPISRQISVEFHEHCFPVKEIVYTEIMSHLGQWYDVVQNERDARHGAGLNRWDSLWVLR